MSSLCTESRRGSAVHDQRLAGHEARSIGIGKKQDGLANFVWFTNPAHDVLLAEASHELGDGIALDVSARQAGVEHWGVDCSGKYRIDAHAFGTKFQRHRSRQR